DRGGFQIFRSCYSPTYMTMILVFIQSMAIVISRWYDQCLVGANQLRESSDRLTISYPLHESICLRIADIKRSDIYRATRTVSGDSTLTREFTVIALESRNHER